jgi:hypothetical protein
MAAHIQKCVVYHPDHHNDPRLGPRTRKLFNAAERGEIILVLEGRMYDFMPGLVNFNGVEHDFKCKNAYGIEDQNTYLMGRLIKYLSPKGSEDWAALVYTFGIYKNYTLAIMKQLKFDPINIKFVETLPEFDHGGDIGYHDYIEMVNGYLGKTTINLIISVEQLKQFVLRLISAIWSESDDLDSFEYELKLYQSLVQTFDDDPINYFRLYKLLVGHMRNISWARNLTEIIQRGDRPIHVLVGSLHLSEYMHSFDAKLGQLSLGSKAGGSKSETMCIDQLVPGPIADGEIFSPIFSGSVTAGLE